MRSFINFFSRLWTLFRSLKPLYQLGAGALLVVVIGTGIVLSKKNVSQEAPSDVPTVSVATIGGLAGNSSGSSVIGTVKSLSQADIFAQTAGTVTQINTHVGALVPAGFVIAAINNTTESAQVLQAQGVYDGAIATRNIIRLQSGNSQGSFAEAQTSARNTYASVYTAVDTTITNQADLLFGAPTPIGPKLLVDQGTSINLSQSRRDITNTLETWRSNINTSNLQEPEALLNQAFANTQAISVFLSDLASAANAHNSGATLVQLAALGMARTTLEGQLAAISSARDAYSAKKTAAQVGTVQTDSSTSETASADATIKSALGSLRAAQAVYERTVVRAPIGGTVNFMPLHVGDYVTNLMHVATVAQNGALEVVAYISEADRQSIAVGAHISVEGSYDGIVTTVAPALDPVNRQIEIHIAITKAPELLNGQTVRITLPSEITAPTKGSIINPAMTIATTTASSTNQQLIPLTALKLTPSARVIFSVGTDNRLVAHAVEIGDVHGDRIVVITSVSADLLIVTDARGLSEGEKVIVSTSTTP
jgi:multidrug resistance efflux pump